MTEIMKTKAFKRRGGCDEDCMNCPYPDCYKPTESIKSDRTYAKVICERLGIDYYIKESLRAEMER